jgi:hypothetical protein
MIKMKRTFSWLCCIVWTLAAIGQDFKAESKVDAVQETGHYKIRLSPDLLGAAKINCSNIRVLNGENIEVPYFVQKAASSSKTSSLKTYKILEKMFDADTVSHLIFHNEKKKEIRNVSLVVTNTDVQKQARLSGSDDQGKWFIIKDDFLLHSMKSSKKTTELKILNFPLSNYEFLKLEFNDKNGLPINIIEVGYYDTEEMKGLSTQFDCTISDEKDSIKTSYLKVELPSKRYFERLKFEVSGAEFYARFGRIKVKKERINSKKKKVTTFETIAKFEINSNSTNEVLVGPTQLSEFFIEIDNKDNKPLTVNAIKASYFDKYLVSELDSTQSYSIKIGGKELRSPDYDVKKFKDKITIVPTAIAHQKVVNLNEIEKVEKGNSIFESPYFIWSIIAVLGLLLGFISFRMIKEIKEK